MSDGKLERIVPFVVVFILILSVAYDFRFARSDLLKWDFMLISGYIAFLLTLPWLFQIPRQFNTTLKRLITRGIFCSPQNSNELLISQIHKKELLCSRLGAMLLCVVITTAYIVIYWKYFTDFQLLKIMEAALGSFCSFLAGKYVGKFVLYTNIISIGLVKKKINVNVLPGHMDGAAGLKPLGEFHFKMALVFLAPIVFLGIWLLIIPNSPFVETTKAGTVPRYQKWEDVFFFLLLLSIGVEVMTFLFPLWTIHKIMLARKNALEDKADRLASDILVLKRKLSESLSETSRKELYEQQEFKSRTYHDIENMPTWPFGKKILQKFTITNILVLIPAISKTVGYVERYLSK